MIPAVHGWASSSPPAAWRCPERKSGPVNGYVSPAWSFRVNRPPGATASQPRAASSFSFDRRPSTFAFSVLSPAAAANSAARSGRPASAATSSRSWYDRGSTDAPAPSRHGGTVTTPTREAGRGSPASPPAGLACGSAAAGSSRTRVTSSRAIASRETCSSALARSPASSSIRQRSRSASARAAASRRLSSSISDPIHGLVPPHTTVEDHDAGHSEIRQSSTSEVPSKELHPMAITRPPLRRWG